MEKTHAQNILKLIENFEEIVITMHINPDGDAIGSSLGLATFLQEVLHKSVCIYNESTFPAWLSFLKPPCAYYTNVQEIPFKNPLVITLDAGELKRFGEELTTYIQDKKSICIDHHLGNTFFATEYTWADPSMSATGEMVAHIVFTYSDKTIESVAKPLYVALSCDTGNFTFGNTSSRCIEILAKLVATPIEIAPIREAMDNTWSEQKLHFWGRLFSEVRFSLDNKFAAVLVPSSYFDEYGVSKEDLEGFVEQMRKVKNVRMTLLMREDVKDTRPIIKVSMRSSGNDDVRAILMNFGGGGHKNAAGATLEGELEDNYQKIYSYVKQALK